MLYIFIGVLAAMAVRELYFEALTRYQVWRMRQERKDFEVFLEKLEDDEADDED